MNDLDGAMEAYIDSIRILENIMGKDNLFISDTYNNVGCILPWMQRFDDAMEIYEDVLRVKKTHLGGKHPSVCLTLAAAMGLTICTSRQIYEANKYFKAALEWSIFFLYL